MLQLSTAVEDCEQRLRTETWAALQTLRGTFQKDDRFPASDGQDRTLRTSSAHIKRRRRVIMHLSERTYDQ
jgi:hypothetical protein